MQSFRTERVVGREIKRKLFQQVFRRQELQNLCIDWIWGNEEEKGTKATSISNLSSSRDSEAVTIAGTIAETGTIGRTGSVGW